MISVKERRLSVSSYFNSDSRFNQLYPGPVRLLAPKHWTPLAVARKAARFLAPEKGMHILDVGSGVGKFCLAAAYYAPNAHFYGIEQRKDLVSCAQSAAKLLELDNVSFIHGNFTQLDLRSYDHIYFFNAFYENLSYADKIDVNVAHSESLYYYYTRYFFQKVGADAFGHPTGYLLWA